MYLKYGQWNEVGRLLDQIKMNFSNRWSKQNIMDIKRNQEMETNPSRPIYHEPFYVNVLDGTSDLSLFS